MQVTLKIFIIQTDHPYNSEVYIHTSKQQITTAKSKSPIVTGTVPSS